MPPELHHAPIWDWVTRFGETAIVGPMAIVMAIWLAIDARRLQPAFAFLTPLGTAAALTLGSKVAFIGWGLGIAALDFTGFSGHAMISAAVYPVLGFVLSNGATRRQQRAAVIAGYVLAGLVLVSREITGAHSWSESITGGLLGASASAVALLALKRGGRHALPMLLGFAMMLWLATRPNQPPLVDSQGMVTQLALQLSGRAQPYVRQDLHITMRDLPPAR